MTDTDNEPTLGPLSDSPVYQELTEPETDSDHYHDKPAVVALAGMATGDSSPATNADKESDHDQLSNDHVWKMREPR
ncbi:hypothetical protein [Endozoicomonas sp. ONNA2]|uniref:hypothetical protein n=1 Tax=Endozoicomonas sp. ONNA2 TaxID=2828741 RepID=UPI002148B31C|nr:hypothetical protein [Endozoicomonas sp. ONNA2]